MAVNVVLKSVFDNKGLTGAQKAFDGFGKNIAKIGGLLAGAFSVGALANFAKAAAEDAKSAALLATQLRNTVGANEEMIASVEQSIKRMQLSAAVSDDVLRPAFAQLVRATGDVSKSQRLMQIALDVSAATGRDVNAVTIALSRAYQGNTTALSRLGIKAEEGVDVFAQLEKQFAGAAETAARNDPFQRLTIIFGELEEQIGQMFLPYLNEIADYFASADFQTAFASMAASIGEAIKQIDVLFRTLTGSTALTFFINLVDAAAVGLAQIAFVAGDAAKTIGMIFAGDFAGAGRQFSTFLDRYNKFVQDIYDEQDAAKARAAETGKSIFTSTIPTVGGGGAGRGRGQSAFEQTRKIIQDAQKKLREANTRYLEAITKARAEYNKTISEAEKTYSEAVAEATKTRDESLARSLADHTKNLAGIQKDFAQRQADIIQTSIDRLRDAYASAVRTNVADLFGTEEVGKSIDNLVKNLRDRLTASRTLVSNSALLASQGFSQTFIEQIVGAGLETGNELATAILQATPETQKELKSLFGALESESETGMNTLSQTIFDKTGLATTELKRLFEQTKTDLAAALKDANQEYTDSQAEILKTFNESMAQAQVARDEAFAAANAKLQEALKEAKDEYLETIDAIKKAFLEQISALEGSLGGLQGTVLQFLSLLKTLSTSTVSLPTPKITTLPGSTGSLSPTIQTLPSPNSSRPSVVVNNFVKVDQTQSADMVGKELSKSINRYTSRGGGLRTSPGAI
jgi:hypothetical protein